MLFVTASLCLEFSYCELAHGDDWLQYRGSNHDGISTETIRTDWTNENPRLLWKRPIDAALSSFAIGGGRALTQTKQPLFGTNAEWCTALDINTGTTIWEKPLGIADYPDVGVGDDDGPRSTPSIDGSRVYVLSSYHLLSCFNLDNGNPIWSHDLRVEYGSDIIKWQNAASPLLEGELVLVNANGRDGERLLAFNKLDGRLAWKGFNDRMTQSSPISATIQGTRHAIFFSQAGLTAVEPQSGKLLWQYPLNYSGFSVAASPVVFGDLVYASRAYPSSLTNSRAGAVVVRISSSGTNLNASMLWYKTNQLMNHWSTPVCYKGFFYGVYGYGSFGGPDDNTLTLRCIDSSDGSVRWQEPGFGWGAVISVGGKILALTDYGDLSLVEPEPAQYTSIGRFHAVDGRCWNVPVVSNGRLYVRSTLEAAAYDVSIKPPPAKLKFLTPTYTNRTIKMLITTEDNSPIDSARGSGIQFYSTTDPSLGAERWNAMGRATTISNGKVQLEETVNPGTKQKVYRAQEVQ